MLPIASRFAILRKKRSGKKVTSDRDLLISGGLGQTIKFWDTADGSLRDKLRAHIVFVYDIQYVMKDRILSSSYDRKIRLWKLSSKKLLQNFKGHKGGVRNLCVLPTQTHFLSSSFDKTVQLWDLRKGESIATCQGHKRYVRCVKYLNHLRMGISGSEDRSLRIWDLEKPSKCVRVFHQHRNKVFDLAIDQRHSIIYSGSSDKTINITTPNTPNLINSIYHDSEIFSLQFMQKKYVVVGDVKGKVTVYDSRKPKEKLRRWNVENGEIWRVIPYKEETQIITASKSIGFWNIRKGKQTRNRIFTGDPTFALCHPREKKRVLMKQCMIDLEDRVRYLLSYLEKCRRKLNKKKKLFRVRRKSFGRKFRICDNANDNIDEDSMVFKQSMISSNSSSSSSSSRSRSEENDDDKYYSGGVSIVFDDEYSSSFITIKGIGHWGKKSMEVWKSIIIYS